MNVKKALTYYHNAYTITWLLEKASMLAGFIAAIVLLCVAGKVDNGGTLTTSNYVTIAAMLIVIFVCYKFGTKCYWAKQFHASMFKSLDEAK